MNGQRVAAWMAAGFGILVIAAVAGFNQRMRERYGSNFGNQSPDMFSPPPRLELVGSGSGEPPAKYADSEPLYVTEKPSESAAAWMAFRMPESESEGRGSRRPYAMFEAKSLDGKVEYRTRSYLKGDEVLLVVSRDYAKAAKVVIVSARIRGPFNSATNASTTWRLPPLPEPIRRLPSAPVQAAEFMGGRIYAVRTPNLGQGRGIAIVAESNVQNRIFRVYKIIESSYADLERRAALIGPNLGTRPGRVAGVFSIPDSEFVDQLKVQVTAIDIEQHSKELTLKSLEIVDRAGFPTLRATKMEEHKVGPATVWVTDVPRRFDPSSSPIQMLPLRFSPGWNASADFDPEVLISRGLKSLRPDIPEPVPNDPASGNVKYGPIGDFKVTVTLQRPLGQKNKEIVVPVIDNEEVQAKLGMRPLQFVQR